MRDNFKSFQNRPYFLKIDLEFAKLSCSERDAFFLLRQCSHLQMRVFDSAAVYAKTIVASASPMS